MERECTHCKSSRLKNILGLLRQHLQTKQPAMLGGGLIFAVGESCSLPCDGISAGLPRLSFAVSIFMLELHGAIGDQAVGVDRMLADGDSWPVDMEHIVVADAADSGELAGDSGWAGL